MAIRLVVISSLGIVYVLHALSSDELPYDPFLYALAGATYGLSTAYGLMLRRLSASTSRWQAQLQFLGDISIVTGLVYYFGGLSSSFSILYLVVVTAAATLLPRRDAVVLANVAWIFYSCLMISLARGDVVTPEANEPVTSWLTYNLVIHLAGFNAVALLVAYLASHVSQAEVRLERASKDLALLEHYHRDVTSSLTAGLITTDLGGQVLTANPAAEAILGQSTEDIQKLHGTETGLLSLEQWERASQVSAHERRRARSVTTKVEGEVHLGFSVGRLSHHDGTQRGYIIIFQDVTNWHQLEEQVRINDRMAAIGELSAGLAHEIGDPLAAISGSVQVLLSSSTPETDSSSRLLDIILNESQRLDRIIKGFLEFARPKEKATSEFDIAELLSENVELLRNSDEVTDKHRVDVMLNPHSVPIAADRDQIAQIFWNLARNAIRAMPDGGRLLVTGEVEEDTYRIQFRDNGKGMNDAERRAMFQPYKTSFDKGTGLGMAIVYRIVHEHGGELSVESAPNLGTTVAVELPKAPAGVLEAIEART